MPCPSCNDENYYYGLRGHDCPNPKCVLPGKKNIVSKVDTQSASQWINQYIVGNHIQNRYDIPFAPNLYIRCFFDSGGIFSVEIRRGVNYAIYRSATLDLILEKYIPKSVCGHNSLCVRDNIQPQHRPCYYAIKNLWEECKNSFEGK